ncbi:short-chain dehydrogenase [Alkalihalobacillus alcalophilus ATCC 27647 = CGMCC 1.3604]|uniref:Short-chain dehydrogenase n=1 Tax=Alkalihalobacillus alcalophilus ATCC 27647 = CGMCC 1.3604 TaxID=1218173 RepID=A0A094YW02_ALKAL|nr:SDR family NAD(P)-dependent oxidoreductase [Alkalihalobacillus alcalophilus]KGA97692.1 short-chain dehydrogenase [Alkalihalobacillus alcalophilus ATCC 27647 = CGMCC 1.3604]MED1562567.1 SDR family NAD(P)-dependent oxidoreductase [Alkalihalobacillus alcalophilus]THG91276.1 short-chain dehydrogenase [Alkalihalobacillus alcalophilus ATCC 27647 = CGMCC 1.3604]
MDLNLAGKTVLVTGGSKGIGQAVALAYLAEGAKVVVVARNEADWMREFKAEYFQFIKADLVMEQEREKVVEIALEKFGSIDILINNVGGSNGSTIAETELSLFYEAFNLNYFSAVHFSQLVLPKMKENGWGSIINISSIFGRESGGKATYNAAKAAMISFTKALADEAIKDGIRVNGVAPGSILHPSGNWKKRMEENPEKMKQFVKNEIPAGRFGTVEEIANVVLFLSSEKASWVVGATLNVDGGQSKSNF